MGYNMTDKLTQEKLKQYLTYDKTTGEFTWVAKVSKYSNYKIGDVAGFDKATGYKAIYFKGKEYPAHRLAWLYIYGVMPTNCIDHINGDPKDNRIDNLRDISIAENNRNTKKSSRNTSGVVGVYFDKAKVRWKVYLSNKYYGSFISKEEAINYRKKLAKEAGYHNNHGRDTNTRAGSTSYRKLSDHTPSWVSSEEKSKIKKLYEHARYLSKCTGVDHVVDHIDPLNGKLVSGFHCLANLQITTREINNDKKHKFSPYWTSDRRSTKWH